jgi:hypothetical protein
MTTPTHDGTAAGGVAEPVAHDGDDAGPTDELDDSAGDLRHEEEGKAVGVQEVGHSERRRRGPRLKLKPRADAADLLTVAAAAAG